MCCRFLQVLIHVVDRQTWKHVKTRYVTDPFFFMHVANAYEEGDHIIMDIPTYKDATILHNMFISTLRVSRVSLIKDLLLIHPPSMNLAGNVSRTGINPPHPCRNKGGKILPSSWNPSGPSCTASWSRSTPRGRRSSSHSRELPALPTGQAKR